ncbi:hypothetical protein DFH09DRAFT_1067443 [Mycena vulgaris]|nr:hypothetical protein DFH09DRAFT_1067443 [Mycena vulgaris]
MLCGCRRRKEKAYGFPGDDLVGQKSQISEGSGDENIFRCWRHPDDPRRTAGVGHVVATDLIGTNAYSKQRRARFRDSTARLKGCCGSRLQISGTLDHIISYSLRRHGQRDFAAALLLPHAAAMSAAAHPLSELQYSGFGYPCQMLAGWSISAAVSE